MAEAEPGWKPQPGTLGWSPTQLAETHYLGDLPLPSQVHYQGPGSEMELPGAAEACTCDSGIQCGHLFTSFSLQIQLLAKVPERAAEDGPRTGISVMHNGDPCGVLRFYFWPDPALAVVAICGLNSWMEDSSFCPSLSVSLSFKSMNKCILKNKKEEVI